MTPSAEYVLSHIRGSWNLLRCVGQYQTVSLLWLLWQLSLLESCRATRASSASMPVSQGYPPWSICDTTTQSPFNDIPNQLPALPGCPGGQKSDSLSGWFVGQCKASTSEGQNKEICIPSSAFPPTTFIKLVFMGFVTSEPGI